MSVTTCYHCTLPVPPGTEITARIGGQLQPFCCEGCKAISLSIHEHGLDHYYQQRETAGRRAEPIDEIQRRQLAIYDRPEILEEYLESTTRSQDGACEIKLYVEGITCAACIWLLENYIGKQPGVISFSINHTNHIARVRWRPEDIKLSTLLTEFLGLGYRARPFRFSQIEQQHAKEQKQAILRLGLAGIGMMQAMMLSVPLNFGGDQLTGGLQQLFRWVSLILTTPVVAWSAMPFFKAAVRDIKVRHLTMDVPVSIAILIAFVASAWITVSGGAHVYYDSVCMFVFFLTLGRFLEMRSRFKATAEISRLAEMIPQTVNRLTDKDVPEVIPVRELNRLDRVLVRPGETVPCDGVIVNGSSTLNESVLTGESVPIARQPGDPVIAGTINVDSPIEVEVHAWGQDTRLSAIVGLYDQAVTNKPKSAHLADKVASFFVAGLLIVGAGVYITWYLLAPERAFEITLAVLVVTCPCALSLATPATFTSAMEGFRRLGLLIVNGHAMEALRDTRLAVFDKTGTLTCGSPRLVNRVYYRKDNPAQYDALAKSAEMQASHPLAKALVDAFSKIPVVRLTSVQQITGKGLEFFYNNQRYRLGSEAFVSEFFSQPVRDNSGVAEGAETKESIPGEMTVWLGDQSGFLACYLFVDEIREDARPTIEKLHRMSIKTALLSGDKADTVARVAESVGIQKNFAQASPEDKLRMLTNLKKEDSPVLMVGDGINDIPVMAEADVSIAMGQSNDITKMHTDAILLNNQLSRIPVAIQLSRKVNRILKQNITWAIVYNLTALPLAAVGLIPPYLAAIGMSFSSVLVVTNALRAQKPPASTD